MFETSKLKCSMGTKSFHVQALIALLQISLSAWLSDLAASTCPAASSFKESVHPLSKSAADPAAKHRPVSVTVCSAWLVQPFKHECTALHCKHADKDEEAEAQSSIRETCLRLESTLI